MVGTYNSLSLSLSLSLHLHPLSFSLSLSLSLSLHLYPLSLSDTNTLPLSSDDCQVIEGLTQTDNADALRSFSKTSVLFVSISFIILMVISLAWLVFYYVQR